MLNPVVSFQPALYLLHLQYLPHVTPFLLYSLCSHGFQDATLSGCLLALPVAPSQSPLLIPPGSLHVGVLWDAVRGTSSCFCEHSLPQWSYPVCGFKCIQSWYPTHSGSGFTSALRARLSTCPQRGKPCPTSPVCPPLMGCGCISRLVVVISVPSARMETPQGRSFCLQHLDG